MDKLDMILEQLQKMETRLNERMDKMDERLDRIETDLTKVRVHVENSVETRLKGLAEGQEAIMQQLIPKPAYSALEDTMRTHETVLIKHAQEIAALKQAQ